MSSEKRFSHPGKVQPGDIFEVFRKLDESVLSTSDINREIDWASRSTIRRRLVDMRNAGDLRSKKAGDQKNAGEVWYPPDEIEDIPQPTPSLLKVIYQHPWFSLMAGGFFAIGFGFTLFMPGYFGQGLLLGLIDREIIVFVSVLLYGVGVAMVTVAGGTMIGRDVVTIIRDFQKQH